MPTLDKNKLNSVSEGFKNSTGLLNGLKDVFSPTTQNDSDPDAGALGSALKNKRNKLSTGRGMTMNNSDDDEKMTGLE